MALAPKPPTFLARTTYRQRRLRDAARLLPLLGAVLVAIPLLWPRGGETAAATSSAIIYVFVVWVVLIALAFVLAVSIDPDDDPAERPRPEKEG